MQRTGSQKQTGRRARLVLALLVVAALSGCWREDESDLRARLERWFAVGETLSFKANRDCVAAAFRLVQFQVKSPLQVVNKTPQMSRIIVKQDVVALDNSEQPPDAALVEIVKNDRALGMKMRVAALEGRACMDAQTESAFRYALDNPQSVLAYENSSATLMLLDPYTGLLVVARGAVEWL